MNDSFLALPIEKQLRITNAALEVFSKHEYKKASTDDIAHLAGISKGALFYYFKNKEALYFYLFDYITQLTMALVMDDGYETITDFYELFDYGASKKVALVKQNPYILDFIMQAYFADNEKIAKHLHGSIEANITSVFSKYFGNIDFSKFKEEINPKQIYHMLSWMADGYLHELQMKRQTLDMEVFIKEFTMWKRMFKKMTYKEEYQDE